MRLGYRWGKMGWVPSCAVLQALSSLVMMSTGFTLERDDSGKSRRQWEEVSLATLADRKMASNSYLTTVQSGEHTVDGYNRIFM